MHKLFIHCWIHLRTYGFTMSCVVKGCKSRTTRKDYKNEFVTFHRFPKDEVLRNLWTVYISRLNWTPKKRSTICSKHFTPESFVPNDEIKYRRLKESAMPTLNLLMETKIIDATSATETAMPKSIPMEINIDDAKPSGTESAMHSLNLPMETKINDAKPSGTAFYYQRLLLDFQEKTLANKTATIGTTTDFSLDSEVEIEIAGYKKNITVLEKELERAKEVNARRLRKINTLTKRNSRNIKKNTQLFDLLMALVKEEDIESKHLALQENIIFKVRRCGELLV